MTVSNDRAPRTMQEAFGAYSSTDLSPPLDRMPEAWDQDDLPHEPMTVADAALTVAIWCSAFAVVGVTIGYLYARFFS